MTTGRRRVLAAVGVAIGVATAGCSTLGGGPDTSPPSEGECPASPRVPNAEPPSEGAELPPIPDPPDALDEETVVEYVEDYELASAWRRSANKLGEITSMNVEGLEASDSRSVDGGIVVTFQWVFPSGEFVGDNGPGYTFDDLPYSASYLVTEDAVWRAQSEPSDQPPEPPEPRKAGTLLQCF